MTAPAPRRPGRARPALLCAVLATLNAGCANDPDVLARVRQQTITVSHFTEVARGNMAQLQGPPDSVKVRLLTDMVNRELLVQAALAEGLDRSPEFAAYRARVEAQVLRESLYQRLLGGPFLVSDAETRELYARRATAARARIIFAFDETFARQARKDIDGGEDFAVVADRYNPSGTIPPGGDVGFLQAGSLLPPLDDLVRTSPIGQIVGPVSGGPEGWFILRVEERRAENQPPFEQVSAQLSEMLRQRKQRAAVARVFEQLRTEHRVVVLPGAPQLLSSAMRAVPGSGPVSQAPAPPGPEDRAKMLARYAGGQYTLGDAYDELTGGLGAGRIDFSVTASVARWLQGQVVERAAVDEARKRRLGDEAEVQLRMRERLNNFLLDRYYQRQVLAGISIEPADYRAAYERYRPSFVRLQSARVVSVTIRDSTTAATLGALAGRAPSLREAVSTAGNPGQATEESLTFPAASPLWTQFESQLSTMRPGEISGPFQVPEGWLLFQLLEKKQDAPAFEELAPAVQAQLQGVATEMKREARLAALTDSLRRAFAPVVVYTDRLRRVPWPPAQAATAGS